MADSGAHAGTQSLTALLHCCDTRCTDCVEQAGYNSTESDDSDFQPDSPPSSQLHSSNLSQLHSTPRAESSSTCNFPGCTANGERKAWGCQGSSNRCEAHASLRCDCHQCVSKNSRCRTTTKSSSGSSSLFKGAGDPNAVRTKKSGGTLQFGTVDPNAVSAMLRSPH